MNVFLGDNITLVWEQEGDPTFVTGQVSGIVLDRHKKVERIYIAGIDHAFWMSQGWKFVDEIEEEDE